MIFIISAVVEYDLTGTLRTSSVTRVDHGYGITNLQEHNMSYNLWIVYPSYVKLIDRLFRL
jgi:hypothetical protein